MKKAFMMVDILVAIVLLAILLLGSVKAMTYMNFSDQINEIRYLTLNRLDSEMARLVMTYENKDLATFVETQSGVSSYKQNPVSDYGLKVIGDDIDIVEIKNIKGNFNIVDAGDIVGYLSWSEDKTTKDANLSLNISYPYRYNEDDTLKPLWDFTENVNLKTITKIKQ
jgi:hypothetical protein